MNLNDKEELVENKAKTKFVVLGGKGVGKVGSRRRSREFLSINDS